MKSVSGLYAIADRSLIAETLLIETVEQCLRGGATVIQYRNKKPADFDAELEHCKKLTTLCQKHHATFIVNDSVRLADLSGADGVHLGQGDTTISEARKLLGEQKIIGQSCHGLFSLAEKAASEGANYVALGRFFPSKTKPDAPLATLKTLAEVKSKLNVPVVAIGGITLDNAPTLIQQGANALALINDLFARDDVEKHSQRYAHLFNQTDKP